MCIKTELEFGVLVFVEGGKPKNPEKNPRARTNNKLNPHMVPGRNRTRGTLVGGELSHHCITPALVAPKAGKKKKDTEVKDHL